MESWGWFRREIVGNGIFNAIVKAKKLKKFMKAVSCIIARPKIKKAHETSGVYHDILQVT